MSCRPKYGWSPGEMLSQSLSSFVVLRVSAHTEHVRCSNTAVECRCLIAKTQQHFLRTLTWIILLNPSPQICIRYYDYHAHLKMGQPRLREVNNLPKTRKSRAAKLGCDLSHMSAFAVPTWSHVTPHILHFSTG